MKEASILVLWPRTRCTWVKALISLPGGDLIEGFNQSQGFNNQSKGFNHQSKGFNNQGFDNQAESFTQEEMLT